MKRNEERTIARLLKTAHTSHQSTDLPPAWRSSVMARIARTDMTTDTAANTTSDFERMAPGFTLAAATLSVIVLVIAGFSLSGLPGELMLAHTTQSFDMSLFSWASL